MTTIPFNNIVIEIDSIKKDKEIFNKEIEKSTISLSTQAFSKLNDLPQEVHTKIYNVQTNKNQKKFIVLPSNSKTNDNSEIISNNDCIKTNYLKDNYKATEPKISEGLNKINHNNIITNEKSSIDFISKKRKICNKFQVFHIAQKNRKVKLSIGHRHKRKYKPDDIRKKIKSRFHKSIKNIINENLRRAGSKYFFSFLPQIFICSIGREKNYQILNLF